MVRLLLLRNLLHLLVTVNLLILAASLQLPLQDTPLHLVMLQSLSKATVSRSRMAVPHLLKDKLLVDTASPLSSSRLILILTHRDLVVMQHSLSMQAVTVPWLGVLHLPLPANLLLLGSRHLRMPRVNLESQRICFTFFKTGNYKLVCCYYRGTESLFGYFWFEDHVLIAS